MKTHIGMRVKGYTVVQTPDCAQNEMKRIEYTGTVVNTAEHPNPNIGHTSYIRLDSPILKKYQWGDPMLIVHTEREGRIQAIEVQQPRIDINAAILQTVQPAEMARSDWDLYA